MVGAVAARSRGFELCEDHFDVIGVGAVELRDLRLARALSMACRLEQASAQSFE
jgi:hypothetical protein